MLCIHTGMLPKGQSSSILLFYVKILLYHAVQSIYVAQNYISYRIQSTSIHMKHGYAPPIPPKREGGVHHTQLSPMFKLN